MRKRFVKLLLFKVDTQYRLLYGFSSETEQSSYLWKAFPADKKGQKLIVKAILSPSEADNFSINLTGTEPIMLRGLTWLTCGYHMALKLDITGFLTLLSQLRSPMMFDTLAFQMAISPLDRELYCAAACSELLYVRLLSAEWLFNAIRDERSQFEVAREIWNRFEPDVRALQEAIVLSNVVFHVRTRRLESEAQWQAIQEVLLSKLASDLPACSGEVINTALDWLHDSNAVSRATLLMTLAERMENSHPQKQLLARAERILKREIQDCQTASDIPRSIALYLNCVDALYGENAENHIFKDILDWNTFEDATEPELQNYD